jgi:hypothetical protein
LFSIDEPIFLPYLENDADAHIKSASGSNRAIVMKALKIIHSVDVTAVTEEVHAVEGHPGFSAYAP